jgi:hypothetical protein
MVIPDVKACSDAELQELIILCRSEQVRRGHYDSKTDRKRWIRAT